MKLTLKSHSYTTLSHCWGSIDLIKLTTTSLESFKESLPINQFPKTFTDAIEVNRRLKIRYIWIDSLCIIQEGDEMKDWSHEASLMQKVYSNSICNISAAGATDGTKGLFFERNLVPKEPIRIKNSRKITRLRLPEGKDTQLYYIFDTDHWKNQVEKGPLNKRAVSKICFLFQRF